MEEEKRKALTKDRLVGMKVIDGEGMLIGVVKDIAFTVGTPISMVIILEAKDGTTKEIRWEEVQAAGDFVVLKAKAAAPAVTPAAAANCPTCGGPLTFIQQYQRWYCAKCQKYV
ncbi:MAG: PRC-barrel domain-containing protein [Candidatus Bathyarchaeia archaeon]